MRSFIFAHGIKSAQLKKRLLIFGTKNAFADCLVRDNKEIMCSFMTKFHFSFNDLSYQSKFPMPWFCHNFSKGKLQYFASSRVYGLLTYGELWTPILLSLLGILFSGRLRTLFA